MFWAWESLEIEPNKTSSIGGGNNLRTSTLNNNFIPKPNKWVPCHSVPPVILILTSTTPFTVFSVKRVILSLALCQGLCHVILMISQHLAFNSSTSVFLCCTMVYKLTKSAYKWHLTLVNMIRLSSSCILKCKHTTLAINMFNNISP